MSKVKCYKCGNMGHYMYKCPSKGKAGETFIQFEENLLVSNHNSGRGGDLYWRICLDMCSLLNHFCNPSLLKNIQPIDDEMTMRCNVGYVTTNLMGFLLGFGLVCFFAKGIANIVV